MIANVKNKKVFIRSNRFDTRPRIISKRKIEKGRGPKVPLENRFEELVTVEISCPVDQRVILEEEITDIKVFSCNVSLNTLKIRQNVLAKHDLPAASREEFTPGQQLQTTRGVASAQKDSQKSRGPRSRSAKREKQKSKSTNRQKRYINVVTDINKISQDVSASRFEKLKFLTKVSVNQNLSASKIKNIQGVVQNDIDLFGEREVFQVSRRRQFGSRRKRSGRRRQREVNIPVLNVPPVESISAKAFKNAYFEKVKIGKDPLSSFEYQDVSTSLQESIKGVSSIDKRPHDKLREVFRNAAQEEVESAPDVNDIRIIKRKESRRNEVYKTTFEISMRRLRRLSSNGALRLVFFAYDQHGIKIDSFGQNINLNQLFKTMQNFTIDFDLSMSRINRGQIISSISNRELESGEFNVYQKIFSKTNNYKRRNFSNLAREVEVQGKNKKRLVDGLDGPISDPLIPKTKSVFQRVTANFEDREISNTKSAGVSGMAAASNQLSCAVYVSMIDGRGEITISNLSEDVAAVIPVKRKARGMRGNNFEIVKFLSNNTLVENNKTFLDPNDPDPVLTFFDDDLENDQIYEYAVILYGKSGSPQKSGSRFLEKNVEREGLISLEIESETEGFTTSDEESFATISFDVTLNRLEDDVDKILNSLFGDNRQLFSEDLKEIKDASNLNYGIRVHRIDTTTGDYVFVGSFRAFSQKSTEDQPSTDLPKTYEAKFTDSAPAANDQIYKIEPYLIPPAQILDKVSATLENLIKNKNRSRSTLNKLLVSKQKILNQQKVSSIGTKYASASTRKGSISSRKSFVEKNKNDLFLEGVTGDIEYEIVSASKSETIFDQFNIRRSSLTLVKTLDTDLSGANSIPKNIVRVNFSVGESDNFVDFYVVLRQENQNGKIIIDGAIHSTDLSDDRKFIRYEYLSSISSSVGIIRYYVVPISKIGTRGPVKDLGTVVLGG